MRDNEYTRQANDFCKNTGTRIVISYKGEAVPDWDPRELHSTYRVRIDRNHKTWSFDFTQSLDGTWKGTRPTKYDVLATVTKYDPGTLDDFVREFGYEINSLEDVRKVERTWKAVRKEYRNCERLFGDVMDELSEIA